GECEGMGQISMKISALPGSVLSENQHLKSMINEQTAHAHVVNSRHNFDFVPGKRAEIITSYFDFEDDEVVKLDLWLAAKAGIHAADLILQVQKDSGGFLPSSDVANLPNLIADNDAVLAELPNGIR
ncbi:hypothetical protein ACJRO0_08310, partial [Acetobacter oryzifermentans]|uniref:hypothetical protein n=1 Tax=Acetobacter oryzifermentans TaxID=1633874 RepID=UPI0039BF75F5